MPMDEPSDPKIVARLKNFPPFDDEAPPETPTEPEAPVEETPPEPPKEPEPTVEAEGEAKTEEPAEESKPVEEKDRTAEQFEKLKAHNAELKRLLEEKKAQEPPKKNALEALIPEEPEPMITNVLPTPQQYPGLSQKEIKNVFDSLTDDQGYVDTGLMKETFKRLSDDNLALMRKNAELEAQTKKNTRRMDDFERKELMRKVHEMYPKLNPENVTSEDPNVKFDDAFYDAFQGEVIRQWTTGGKEDVWSAAKKWSDILYQAGMKKIDKEKMEAAELAKKNINATNAKPASTVSSYKNDEELIMATRKGNHNAIMERLNRIGQ